ncbi:O-antigen ligase family protein [Candidatus Parcubacteria bacterium]|nr:O-antigen ligase family protein [Candidatus Parcubacteria bacterium]
MNRYLRYALLTGLFAVPFISFIVTPSLFFPYITGKNFAFRALIEIMLALWAVLALRDVTYRPRFSAIAASFGALVLTMGISTIFAENPAKSFWSNFERMEGYITLLHLGAYFLVLGAVLNREALWERWFQTSLVANALMCGYAFLQYFGAVGISQSADRLDGTFGNATYLAVYTLFHIFLAAFLFLRHKGGAWVRYAYGAVALLNIFVLYNTGTRGSMLGLIAGVGFAALLIALFERDNRMLRRVAIGSIVSILVLVGAFLALKETALVQKSSVLQRFASISLTEGTVKARFLVWNMAFQGFKENPVFGWGQENFNYVFNKYYDPKMYDQEQWFDRTHNVFFDWLIAGGALGLLGYLALFAAALYALFRRINLPFTERAVLAGMLLAYFVHNLFVFDNLISYLYFVAFLAYLHERSLPASDTRSASPETGYRYQVAVSAIVLAAFASLYFFNVRPILASNLLIKAISPQADPATNISYFKKALAYGSFGDQEIREQLSQGTSALRNANIALPVKQEFFDLARTEYVKMIGEVPNDARHPLFLGAMLNNYGSHEEAVPYLERAHELSPRKQTILFEIGSNYLNAKDFPKAVAAFKEAYELEPGFRDARIIYAMGLIYAGDNATATKVLTEGFGTPFVGDDRLVKAYGDTQQYGKMLELVKLRIQANPDAQGYLTLAAAYCQASQGTNAVAALKKLIEIAPSYKDQATYYITEIQAGRECK